MFAVHPICVQDSIFKMPSTSPEILLVGQAPELNPQWTPHLTFRREIWGAYYDYFEDKSDLCYKESVIFELLANLPVHVEPQSPASMDYWITFNQIMGLFKH